MDYALIVGVNKYPAHDEYEDLKGAKRDAEEFFAWLTSPDGANLSEKKRREKLIRCHYSNKQGTEPRLDDIVESIDELMDLQELRGRVGRRLYIFLAGHGVGKSMANPVLLAADHRRRRPSVFEGRKIADMFCELAAFEEVVLFMDCCRDQMKGLGPGTHYDYDADPDAAEVKRCYGLGTQVNRQSFERKFGRSYHGIFSWFLMQGLKGGAANEEGEVTAGELEKYVKNRLEGLGETGPEFITPNPDLVLVTGVTPKLVPVEIRLTTPENEFEVHDGKNIERVLEVKREELAPGHWRIHLRLDRTYLVRDPATKRSEYFKTPREGDVTL